VTQHMQTHIHTHTNTHTHMLPSVHNLCIQIHAHTHTCCPVCITCAYKHTHTRAHTHMHTNTHMHAYKQTHTGCPACLPCLWVPQPCHSVLTPPPQKWSPLSDAPPPFSQPLNNRWVYTCCPTTGGYTTQSPPSDGPPFSQPPNNRWVYNIVPSFRWTSTVLTAAQQQVGVHVLPNNRWVYSIVPSFRWTSTIFTATQQQVRVGCMNVQLAVMCKIFKRMYMSRVGQNRISAPYMTVCMVLSLLKIPFVHRLCL